MTSRLHMIMTVGSLLLLASWFQPRVALEAAGLNKKHDFGCSRCHSTHRAKGKRLWAETPPTQTSKGTPLLGLDAMCYSCHQGAKGGHMFDGGFTHPTGIPVKPGQIPSSLPTAKVKGLGEVMTCLTCHNPHTKAERMLRVPMKDDQLCLACHRFD
ncbi:MAG: hypothetical protein HY815_27175 [Candidatus Riflebacteria bacterium]|nr:hypothetical protein [Candidatus Riflebacteria bacterium]